MAIKLVVLPIATDAVPGVTAIAVNVAGVTVSVALFEVTPFADAVTDVLPCAKLDAIPLLLSVATVVFVDAQITEPDTLPVLLSE